MKSKKSQITMYVVFIILSIIIVVITSVVAPMGVLFTAEMVAAGEDIMLRANESINKIQNDTIRESIRTNVKNALDAADMNIEVNTALFQYSWIIILLLTGIVIFLFTRQLIEIGGQRLV